MTDKDRIERLEAMVKTLADICAGLIAVVNTGSYEYALHDTVHALNAAGVEEFSVEWRKERKADDRG